MFKLKEGTYFIESVDKRIDFHGELLDVPGFVRYVAISPDGTVTGYSGKPYYDTLDEQWIISDGIFSKVTLGVYAFEGNIQESLVEV